ncbi:hypothetical protein COCVIDRAFT_96224 [Bipolaris victoriae FI3]|uniref:Uncharacterized protein n=2 Tax=Bipolaris TaxID=33194 RepID=W6Y7U2_COCC2|nr:uncharacterized protein COCCADRAFT_94617 [Bipolaris zeicola 26-R-13]XP_014557761.1 hypothetical protein COCVIDRAFT_96224 [Bipolaris victoriae FI3]EUC34013.1 hypothetical protein COCCADRAFT_94617 [Bipolaris zeicola 26-R-13]
MSSGPEQPFLAFCISTASAFTPFGTVACVRNIPLGLIWFDLWKRCEFGVRVSHMGYP